jgi:hypothetical protein
MEIGRLHLRLAGASVEKPDGRSALAPWDERLSTSQIEAVMLKSTE